MTPQAPPASKTRRGKQRNVHALLDKGCRRKNRELAWEQGQKHRGRAGIDEVSMAACEERKASDWDLLHRTRREGTDQPKPVQRVESAQADGGIRTLGIPAVLDRVCPQGRVQRRGPIVDPTCLDRACGDRPGRSPQDARRQVWQELNAG